MSKVILSAPRKIPSHRHRIEIGYTCRSGALSSSRQGQMYRCHVQQDACQGRLPHAPLRLDCSLLQPSLQEAGGSSLLLAEKERV